MTATAWNASSPSWTAAPIDRTDRPTTSPGRSGRPAKTARAMTCFAIMDGRLSTSRFQSSSHRRASDMPALFLDCDGVLADFDRGAEQILGMRPDAFQKRFGNREFWKRLGKAPDF